jgi:hypothetical protein
MNQLIELNHPTPFLDQGHALSGWYLISDSHPNPRPSTRVHIGISAYLRQLKSCVPILGHTISIGPLLLPYNSAWSIPFRSLMPLTLPLALGRPIKNTSWIMLLETRI